MRNEFLAEVFDRRWFGSPIEASKGLSVISDMTLKELFHAKFEYEDLEDMFLPTRVLEVPSQEEMRTYLDTARIAEDARNEFLASDLYLALPRHQFIYDPSGNSWVRHRALSKDEVFHLSRVAVFEDTGEYIPLSDFSRKKWNRKSLLEVITPPAERFWTYAEGSALTPFLLSQTINWSGIQDTPYFTDMPLSYFIHAALRCPMAIYDNASQMVVIGPESSYIDARFLADNLAQLGDMFGNAAYSFLVAASDSAWFRELPERRKLRALDSIASSGIDFDDFARLAQAGFVNPMYAAAYQSGLSIDMLDGMNVSPRGLGRLA